ncbi:hypothetical protein PAXINDRAFT_100088 [Paxillus involutus ATCC 200175]|uniref:Uncharacterized protein n=1 Tax=Paxillus involutus ATCC 200175 TaxID=664439 RepID=A0A0C9U5C8_PAXIN|nr:hypothetical protein PAXINDRAFT_100088 [Paxillus involutus ATCC 200175]
MPPKRRTPAKAAPAAKAAPPAQPAPAAKQTPPSTKAVPPAPVQPPPPPPQPVEFPATKVRKEWNKFIDAWYEPQKKKLLDKLQKDILLKYKDLGPPKETQKLREMELFEKLDSIAEQLTQPARKEWERRLDAAQLREDQWDDMSGEEQQAVMGVFIGFFDEVEEAEYVEDTSADPSSIEEEDSVFEESQLRGFHGFPSSSKLPTPPTPTRGTFEFVSPSTFFTNGVIPSNPTKNLPALSIDHLATLGPSNTGRTAEPASASVGGVFGFQSWASEAGIAAQQPQVQVSKSPSAAMSASQTLSARPRATDNISRQPSAASNFSSPPLKTSSPQYSPPNPTAGVSPPITAENLPLGKRYIGPVITEEPDPMEEEFFKSKMAADFQEFKISLRIQMIYQFHAEAAQIEIKLVEMLLAEEGTKESRARAVQEHEASMMLLRDQKEEERKRLCGEEREKRREEIKHRFPQVRSTQNKDVDSRGTKASFWPDQTVHQQRWAGHATHQKENVPLTQPVASSSKLELPGILKKSISALSQDEASANETLFANAMATMAHGKLGAAGLTPAQVSSNEALFANAAAMLSAQGRLGTDTLSVPQPSSIMKKTNSSRSQEHDIPQIIVNHAKPPAPTPVPATTVKGKKGKKGQPAAQQPLQPVQPVTVTEEFDIDAEPPPAPSFWGAAATTAKSTWGVASASASAPKNKHSAFMTEGPDLDAASMIAQAPSGWGSVSKKKTIPAGKKGKAVTITEESDVEADPIVSPPSSLGAMAAKGGWGSVNSKSKMAHVVVEESEPEPAPAPPATPVWGKKTTRTQAPAKSTSTKQPVKTAFVSEEQESDVEPAPTPARTNNHVPKTTWGAPAATPNAGTTNKQAGKKATQQQAEPPRRVPELSAFKSVRVEAVPDPEEDWAELAAGGGMPGGLEFDAPEDAEEEYGGGAGASAWLDQESMDYWANVLAGQSETQNQAVSEPTEKVGKHVRWTPTVDEESDDEELEEVDEALDDNIWLQYAISGGDIPSLDSAPAEPQVMPSDNAQRGAGNWEHGKGKKKLNQSNGDNGNRAQQASFDRAAFSGGQWPKMESWLSSTSRAGQSSGSARFF